MLTKSQEKLLEEFADKSDKLHELGVTTTDSFTGEIAEYIVCKHLDLIKSPRVTRAIDAVSKNGIRYQIKSKVLSKEQLNYNIKKLEIDRFDILAIVYFDKSYTTKLIVLIPSSQIVNGEINITKSIISQHKSIDGSLIKIPYNVKKAISEFAVAYNNLEENKLVRSRRIVGDIGEMYACKKLSLQQSQNKNEKGIDARHKNGLTFEIKTRRVYSSGRRLSETRRINNLVGKTADYLVIVVIDRTFKCIGMWMIPMKNLINPQSAKLQIVNNTEGTLNIIASQVPWLKTGKRFEGFKEEKTIKKVNLKVKENKTEIRDKIKTRETNTKIEQSETDNSHVNKGCGLVITWILIFLSLVIAATYLIE